MLRRTIGAIWKGLPRRLRTTIARMTQTKFTISASAVVVNEKREVLLLDHVLRPRTGWGFPGGFLDAGEQAMVAVRREAREEIGIELEDLKLYRVNTHGRHFEIIFTARADGEPRVLSREIYTAGWYESNELPAGVGREQAELIGEVLADQI